MDKQYITFAIAAVSSSVLYRFYQSLSVSCVHFLFNAMTKSVSDCVVFRGSDWAAFDRACGRSCICFVVSVRTCLPRCRIYHPPQTCPLISSGLRTSAFIRILLRPLISSIRIVNEHRPVTAGSYKSVYVRLARRRLRQCAPACTSLLVLGGSFAYLLSISRVVA